MRADANKLIRKKDYLSVLIPSIRRYSSRSLTLIAVEELNYFLTGRMRDYSRRPNQLVLGLARPISDVTLSGPAQSFDLSTLKTVRELAVFRTSWVKIQSALVHNLANNIGYCLSFTSRNFCSDLCQTLGAITLVADELVSKRLQVLKCVPIPNTTKLAFKMRPYLLQVIGGRQ